MLATAIILLLFGRMVHVTPLNRFPIIRTERADEMEVCLQRVFGASRFDLDSSEPFYAEANHIALQDISLSYCSYRASCVATFPESDYARQQFAIAGQGAVKIDGQEEAIVSGEKSAVTSPRRAARLSFGTDYQQLVLRIREEALRLKIAVLTGRVATGPLVFSTSSELLSPSGQLLNNSVRFLVQTLSRQDAPSDLLLREVEQTIITAFLFANVSNFGESLEAPKYIEPSSTVRRVQEYLESHFADPITIEGLSAVAGVSARAVFAAFHRHLGVPPKAYLKQLRLKKARQKLLVAEPGTSVTNIALACGFNNMSHFANDYSRAFGESPSTTLQKARRLGR